MRYLTIQLVCILTFPAFGQDAAPDMVTDRPDQTESSSVVPHRFLQIETGFLMAQKEDDEYTQKSLVYNTTLLRYGLLENFELRLGMEYLGGEIMINSIDTSFTFSGFGPLYTGFKVMIAEEEGWRPEMAFLGGLALPFTASDEFRPENTSASMRFAFSHTLSDRFSLGYNLGAFWGGDTPIPQYFYSVALGIGITQKLGMYIEGFGEIPESGSAQHMLDGGFTFLALPNLQFDISGGIGINEVAPDYYFGAGLSYRIPQ